MIERSLFEIIKAKIDWFKADSRRFANWLVREKLLEKEEAAKAKLYWDGDPNTDPPTPPKFPHLVHGYAREGGPFPCIALTLGSETIATDYLGRDSQYLGEIELELLDNDDENTSVDSTGRYIDPETGEVVDPHVRRMRYTFNFMVHANHPDVCIWYYQLIKWIIMSSHKELESKNIEDLTLSGQDVAPDPRYLPSEIFTRMLSVTCEGDETWEQEINAPGNHIEVSVTINTSGN